LAYDLIGTGPRLQLSIPGATVEQIKQVRRRYQQWARAAQIGLAYRIMEKSVSREGNIFAILDTDPNLRDQVKLSLRLVEDEQCCTPTGLRVSGNIIDGIELDNSGRPVRYWFLRNHPGENTYFAGARDYFAVEARNVIHWYERDRAGQIRGVPRIVAGLPMFGKSRRFTDATITAAEFAASIAGVLESSIPPQDGQAVSIEAMDRFEMIKQMLLTLPQGWKANQMKAEHPTTTYGDFKRENMSEAGRGTGAPLNVVSGNSSGYNFSSGRLDHLPYQRGLTVDRDDFRNIVADPVFLAWHDEAAINPDYLPANLPPIEEWTWNWRYDGFDSIDQNKDATADDTRLKNGTTNYDEIYSAYGQDWQEEFEQAAREKEYAESLGLPWPLLFGGPMQAIPAPNDPNAPMVDPIDDTNPDDTALDLPRRPAAYTGGRR
jgi:lambda family phage portal protein